LRVPAPQPACTSDSPILFRADANLVVQIRHWNSKEGQELICSFNILQHVFGISESLRADANLVVEIKHWKSKEKKFSLLAWSFLPAHVLITRSDGGIYGADGAPF